MKTSILRAALFTPGPNKTWGLPILLWGAPGVAKSAIFRQLADECRMPIEVLSPAARGEGAFGVTPVPDGGRMTYPRPDWTDKFVEAGRGIVFVDEINLAATHYAGALLGLLQDRVLGSYQLGPGVRIFAAANPVDLAAASGGWDLSAPAANRVGHLQWQCPEVREWTAWLFGHDLQAARASVDADQKEARVLEFWEPAWATARGVVAGFLSAKATLLHQMPPVGSSDTSRAWPSPRTWEFAARALASADVHVLAERDLSEFVAAFVGEGATAELLEWRATASLPSSEALLDGHVKWKHRAARLDVTMAVFSSAVQVCISTADEALRDKRARRMWELLDQASGDAADLVVPPARRLSQALLMGGALKVTSKLKEILEAASIQ